MVTQNRPDLDCSPLLDLLTVCGVVGAALIAAQKDKHVVKQAEREESESLRDLAKSLQAELEVERLKRQQAEKALADEK